MTSEPNNNVIEETKQTPANWEPFSDADKLPKRRAPRPAPWIGLTVIALCVVCVALIVGLFLVNGRYSRLQQETAAQLSQQAEAIAALEAQLAGVDSLSAEQAAIAEQVQTQDAQLKAHEESIVQLQKHLPGAIEENPPEEAPEATESPENTDAPETTEPEASGDYITHVVQPGETLLGICQKYGINYYAHSQEILDLNNLSDPGRIEKGQTLLLPKP